MASIAHRVLQWALRLQKFKYEVIHRPGKLNSRCDGLSRDPLNSTKPYGEEGIEPLYTVGTRATARIKSKPKRTSTTKRTQEEKADKPRTTKIHKRKRDGRSAEKSSAKKATNTPNLVEEQRNKAARTAKTDSQTKKMAQKDKAKTAEQIRQASAAETRRQDQQDIATKAMSDNPLDRPTTEEEWVKANK